MRVFLHFDCVPLCFFVYISEGGKEGRATPSECELGKAERRGLPPLFFSGEKETPNSVWCVPFICSLVGLALVTVACFILSHEPPT